MGGGQSSYVSHQEYYVQNNRDIVKNQLKHFDRNYTKTQIDNKLRQHYAGTDNSYENYNSYINHDDWNFIKLHLNK